MCLLLGKAIATHKTEKNSDIEAYGDPSCKRFSKYSRTATKEVDNRMCCLLYSSVTCCSRHDAQAAIAGGTCVEGGAWAIPWNSRALQRPSLRYSRYNAVVLLNDMSQRAAEFLATHVALLVMFVALDMDERT